MRKLSFGNLFSSASLNKTDVSFDLLQPQDVYNNGAPNKKPNKYRDKSVFYVIFCGSFATVYHGYPQASKEP